MLCTGRGFTLYNVRPVRVTCVSATIYDKAPGLMFVLLEGFLNIEDDVKAIGHGESAIDEFKGEFSVHCLDVAVHDSTYRSACL